MNFSPFGPIVNSTFLNTGFPFFVPVWIIRVTVECMSTSRLGLPRAGSRNAVAELERLLLPIVDCVQPMCIKMTSTVSKVSLPVLVRALTNTDCVPRVHI